MLADNLSEYVAPMFDASAKGTLLTAPEAWLGALAYTFQLYFDFSGYSDMAIGMSLILGVSLPINFNSPYRARNMIEFWRRWHISLSTFLRDYLYIPLGGNRRGELRRYVNILVTMVLGGLWHGASWMFVIWGAIHGVALVLNHVWQKSFRNNAICDGWLGRFVAWALTFCVVVVGWIFFRSTSINGAINMTSGLLRMPEGALHPHDLVVAMNGWLYVGVAATIAFFAPNTQQFFGYVKKEAFSPAANSAAWSPMNLVWRPNVLWAVICGVIFTVSLTFLYRVHEFLYFQF